MKMLMAIALILVGVIWSYYATFNATMMRTLALSDAMQLEADLNRWASGKVSESDRLEIFPENYSLRFGGESKDKNFREMIAGIAVSSAPPVWPGVASIVIGLVGAMSLIRGSQLKSAEQAAAPNRSAVPSLDPTPSVRDSEG